MKNEERETLLNLNAQDRIDGGCWSVFSDDPTMIEKLKRVCLSKRRAGHGGWWFTLAQESVTFRKPLTDEQRAERIERLKKSQP